MFFFPTSVFFIIGLLQVQASSKSQDALLHQVYLDVKPINTTLNLEAIRAINLSTYRYAYERQVSSGDRPRLRIGVLGPDLAQLIPDAVEIVAKRTLPPVEKGGSPITLHDVPVVNEHILFMYGIGATQELITMIDKLKEEVSQQVDRVMDLFGENEKLEHMLSSSSNDEALLRMRAAAAEAEIKRKEMELEIQKAKDDEEFVRAQKEAELAQIRRNDHLTSERLKQEDEIAKIRSGEELRNKYESNKRLEIARSNAAATLSKMEYEREVALQRVSEELKTQTAQKIAEAKATAERANEDVRLRKLKAEAEQNRKRNIAAINAIASHISQSFFAATKNPKKIFLFIWYITMLASGVYTAREVAKFFRVIIESTIGKPKLIRETSRKSLPHQYFTDMLYWLRYVWSHSNDIDNIRSRLNLIFDDVALPMPLKERVLNLATAASRSRDNNAPQRHILFYGPPGTGKTMVARKLAKSLGMEYAMMSGGDVGPLGTDAVTQIHGLFRWSKFCRNGVLLFIDEAEAFLANRSTNNMSENAHNALNALLYNTGTERKDFMMVLATNRAEDLDSAVLDRCDESLYFPLPDAISREKLLRHYFNTYISKEIDQRCIKYSSWYQTLLDKFHTICIGHEVFNVKIENDVMNKEQINRLVYQTSTFSGREIAKLMIAIQGAAYAAVNGTLTSTLVDNIVMMKVVDHKEKRRIIGSQEEEIEAAVLQSHHSDDDEASYSGLISLKEEASISDNCTSQEGHVQNKKVSHTINLTNVSTNDNNEQLYGACNSSDEIKVETRCCCLIN